MAEKRAGGELRNWIFIGSSISGRIYNDEKYKDGEYIKTSYIV
jgi:hypothetical protein